MFSAGVGDGFLKLLESGVRLRLAKFYKVHFRASILARLPYQKCLKKLGWRVISKKNLLVILTGASCLFQKIQKI